MIRRKAREFALKLLYQADIRREPPELLMPSFWESYPRMSGELRTFAEELVRGTWEHLAEIDAVLSGTAHNWRLDRMSYMDRNILRLATFELRHLPDIPPVVSINEAIEIAKVYGTEDSAKFVNGILNRIKDDLPPGLRDAPEGTAEPVGEPPG